MLFLKVVLDTNCILRCISRRSEYSIVIDKLQNEAYQLFITNDILLEYEEKISDIFSSEVAELTLGAFEMLPNVHKTEIHFQLNLISADPDDNKFVDCAFAGNVHFIVSDDKHFRVLSSIVFPNIRVISLEDFKSLLIKL